MLRLVTSRATSVITIDVTREAEKKAKLAASGGGPPPASSSGSGPAAAASTPQAIRPADMVKPSMTKANSSSGSGSGSGSSSGVGQSQSKAPSVIEALIDQINTLISDIPRIRKVSTEKAVSKFFVSQYHAHINGVMEKVQSVKLTLKEVGSLIKFSVKQYLEGFLKPSLDAYVPVSSSVWSCLVGVGCVIRCPKKVDGGVIAKHFCCTWV